MVNKDMKGMVKLKGNDDEYSRQIRNRIKGSCSSHRKLAQKINSLPYMKDENVEKEIVALISNPELSAVQIQRLLQKALERNLSDTNFIALIKTMIMKHQALFGHKLEIKQNLSLMDDVMRREAIRERLFFRKLLTEKEKEFKEMFGEEAGKWFNNLVYEINVHIQKTENQDYAVKENQGMVK